MIDIQRLSKQDIGNILFTKTKMALAFVNRDGVFLRANDEMTKILGYTEYELTQKNISDITHPEDLAADTHLMQKTLNGDIDGYPMMKRYFTKNGKIIWCRLIVTGVEGADNTVACFFSQIVPIDNADDSLVAARDVMARYEKGNKFVNHLKKEWKWILIYTITGIGGIIGYEVNRRNNIYKNEQRVVQTQEQMDGIQSKLDDLLQNMKNGEE